MRAHRDGEFPFANDFNAMTQALEAGTQVESGCGVSDGGTDDLSLDVAAGSVVVDGSEASVGAQSVTLSGADADHDRYDIVVADTGGTASVVTGTASATPQAPGIPDGTVLLAIVEVPAGASGVTDSDVYDARVALDGIANTAIAALSNLAAGEQFSGYPLTHGVDTDAQPSAHHSRPSPGNALVENSGAFDVQESDIDHGNLTGIGPSEHHTKTPTVSATAVQEVTGSRSRNTWYQNTTGNPLVVYITVVDTNNSGSSQNDVHLNSTQTDQTVQTVRSSSRGGATIIVPDNWHYKCDGNDSIENWFEHRLVN